MSVRVRAKLPKGDQNGLSHLEGWMAKNPDGQLVVVAIVQADTIETRPHADDDKRVVKAVILHLEAIESIGERDQAEKMMRDVYAERTGKAELPFEDQPADKD